MDLLQEEATRGDLTLRRVFEILGEEGHAVLLLFFCLPFLQPIPIPGLSTPLGFMIVLISIFLFRQVPPWLPKRYENLKISAAVVIRVSNVAERIWKVVSKIVKARLEFLHDLWVFRALNLCLFIVNAVLLSLPLPIPFSNTVPAIAIILCAIGNMEKDGVFILFSYLWCLIVACFFASLTMGAVHFMKF
jgi:hypothetical protein